MIKSLIVNLIISLGVGGLSSYLTKDSMQIYKDIILPQFAPPSWLFGIVWSILYVLMAISATIVYESSPKSSLALGLYALQLIFNFIWPLLFFNGRMFLASFLWIIVLWILVLWMIIEFYKVKPIAGYLQIPYLLWLTFAAILNLSIYFLNK